MNNVYKGKAKYILASALLLLLITVVSMGRSDHFVLYPLYPATDTIPPLPNIDTLTDSNFRKIFISNNLTDSIVPKVDTLNVKASKDSLDAPVVYHADDSMLLDVTTKKIILYD